MIWDEAEAAFHLPGVHRNHRCLSRIQQQPPSPRPDEGRRGSSRPCIFPFAVTVAVVPGRGRHGGLRKRDLLREPDLHRERDVHRVPSAERRWDLQNVLITLADQVHKY